MAEPQHAGSVLPAGVSSDLLDVIVDVGSEKLTAATSWEEPGLENGWTNFGSGYAPAAFSLDTEGHCLLRGRVKAGSVGVRAFLLPDGHKPAYVAEHIVRSAAGTAVVEAHPNGEVVIHQGGTGRIGMCVPVLHPNLNSASQAPTLIDGVLLYLNGSQTVPRQDFPELFALISTHYGAGNGSTTFGIPDFRNGRNPISRGANFPTLNAMGGEILHTQLQHEMASHTHGINIWNVGGPQSFAHNHQQQNILTKGIRTDTEAVGYGLQQGSPHFGNRVYVYAEGFGIETSEPEVHYTWITLAPFNYAANADWIGGQQPFNIMDPYTVISGWAVVAAGPSTWTSLDGVRFRVNS
jgi:microcystin-dependent protein